MSEKRKIMVPVEISVFHKALILRQHVGEGSGGGVEFRMSTQIPTGAPIIEIGDICYVIEMQELARVAVEDYTKTTEQPTEALDL